ncbi:MAG: protease, partial [Propionibacteriales bacterium]|nr:protease [Propionibacteriales bacterium]
MRKSAVRLFGLTLAVGLGASLGAPSVQAVPEADAPVAAPEAQTAHQAQGDELPNPAEEKRRALREQALTMVLNGEAKAVKRGPSTVVKVSDGQQAGAARNERGRAAQRGQDTEDQYVELAREKTDNIFVIVAEFGNERHPDYPDQDTDPTTPGPTTFDGPLHNAIPEPDRTKDNATVWQADYDREHYQDMYFKEGADVESVKTYYEKQSSGRYSVDGLVTDWVKVRFNEARYGRSDGFPCAGSVCSNTWQLVRDGVNQWVADQVAAGRTEAEIAEQLADFDVWDRYDFDNDGDFNEADGYID